MSSIRGLAATAYTTRRDVQEKYVAVKALDNNTLFDRDSRIGRIDVAVDNWVSKAVVRTDGQAASFEWKSTGSKPGARNEAEGPTVEHEYKIVHTPEQTRYAHRYVGPGANGEGQQIRNVVAIFDNGSGNLNDCIETTSGV